MIATEDGYQLSSGRKIYANKGIIGIDPDWGVFEGYDGYIDEAKLGYAWLDYDPAIGGRLPFTQAEALELADFMLRRWQEYRDMWANPPILAR